MPQELTDRVPKKYWATLFLVLEECPYCHKLFSVEQISKAEVDSNIITPERVISGRGYDIPDAPSMDFITYSTTYKCKHCGKEWTKPTEREVDIPRAYVEAEQEKTEYDADRQEEQARQEQEAKGEEPTA